MQTNIWGALHVSAVSQMKHRTSGQTVAPCIANIPFPTNNEVFCPSSGLIYQEHVYYSWHHHIDGYQMGQKPTNRWHFSCVLSTWPKIVSHFRHLFTLRCGWNTGCCRTFRRVGRVRLRRDLFAFGWSTHSHGGGCNAWAAVWFSLMCFWKGCWLDMYLFNRPMLFEG